MLGGLPPSYGIDQIPVDGGEFWSKHFARERHSVGTAAPSRCRILRENQGLPNCHRESMRVRRLLSFAFRVEQNTHSVAKQFGQTTMSGRDYGRAGKPR